MPSVDLSECDLPKLLISLWEKAPVAPIFNRNQISASPPPTVDKALKVLESGEVKYLNGKKIGINFSDISNVDPTNYNQDVGNNAFEKSLEIISNKEEDFSSENIIKVPTGGSVAMFFGKNPSKDIEYSKVILTPNMKKIAEKSGHVKWNKYYMITNINLKSKTYYLTGSVSGTLGPYNWNKSNVIFNKYTNITKK